MSKELKVYIHHILVVLVITGISIVGTSEILNLYEDIEEGLLEAGSRSLTGGYEVIGLLFGGLALSPISIVFFAFSIVGILSAIMLFLLSTISFCLKRRKKVYLVLEVLSLVTQGIYIAHLIGFVLFLNFPKCLFIVGCFLICMTVVTILLLFDRRKKRIFE